MPRQPLWKAYGDQIDRHLKEGVATDAEVTFDPDDRQRLPGRLSKIDRQIDMLVRGKFAGLPGEHLMVIDCKQISRHLSVVAVECFLGLVETSERCSGSS